MHICAPCRTACRKMIHVPRRPEESAETHMTRWARLLRNCRAKHKFPHGDETYFASFFSWSGHVARITIRDICSCIKNMAWHRSLKKELGTQCHGRRFRVWRWEQPVVHCLGDEWAKLAQNSSVWRSKLEEMINWKKRKWLIARVLTVSGIVVLSVQ